MFAPFMLFPCHNIIEKRKYYETVSSTILTKSECLTTTSDILMHANINLLFHFKSWQFYTN